MVGFPNKPMGFPTRNDHFGVWNGGTPIFGNTQYIQKDQHISGNNGRLMNIFNELYTVDGLLFLQHWGWMFFFYKNVLKHLL